MFVNSCLALCKNLLFLLVEQSPNLCFLVSLFNGSPRSVSNQSRRSVGHWRRRQTDRQVFSWRVISMCSVCLVKHILECSVIVVGVRRRDFVGEERRRVQELRVGLDWGLLEVVGVGLITCGEEELVRRVHTLCVQSAQVVYELQVQEEMERVRQEVREIERGEQGEEKRSHEHDHVDGVKDSLLEPLEPRCVCSWRCTDKKELDSARSRSDIVEACGSGHVVIGVRIVQCHHAIMDNCEHVVIGVRVMHCHHAFMANS